MTSAFDAEGGQTSASTLELFFDLVFVFTITQLTHVYTHDPGWAALGQVAVLFGLIWWMYSGYVWLTNEVAPNSSARRTWLLIGMFGFFVLALAIPDAFHGTGIAFGLAYLLVNVIHSALFASAGGQSATRAIRRIAPLNGVAAILVLAGGFLDGPPEYLCWAGAFALQIINPRLVQIEGFVVRAHHFCERHGLVVIIALGESVVAIGAGLAGEPITVALVAQCALGLALTYVLWWSYFGVDDERGEHALAAVPDRERSVPAVLAYGYSLYPLLIGIVVLAAGIKMSIAHGNSRASLTTAATLSGGVALYFLGQFFFRLSLRLPRARLRLVSAGAVAATIPIGVVWVSWAQLLALVVVGYAAVITDDLITLRGGGHSQYI
ncbi:low temperature requirement protein A [Nocardia panacis]|uniref:Low temperature requirement protein A n=1 Tax=Nocardia panacis TaxID=2340916 RepID=A0A3A4K7Z6_9NOCA|nr:low temperature requirement protein A [Nocardia panacis]RJO69318.1 low temperature requirement protein A [Nocardia panacis]